MLLEAREITKAFGSFRAVDAASVTLEQGDILGLIGPNGAGKSTFFNCVAGDVPPTAGRIVFSDVDVTRASAATHARLGIGRTFQVPATFEEMSILDNVMVGAFLRHHQRGDARAAALAIVEFTGLKAVADAPAKSLGTFAAGLLPAVGWILASFILAMPRPNGSVIITASAAGEWYLYGGALACAAGCLTAFFTRLRRPAPPR